jgi:coenzyme F420-reducing hydrogenase delta subunit
MHSLLDFVGIEAGRLRIDWVSAAEGNRFAQIVSELTDQVRQLGPWTGLQGAGLQATGGQDASLQDRQ